MCVLKKYTKSQMRGNTMYPEFEKVNEFLAKAKLLEQTNMTMKDIYEFIMSHNKKYVASEFINEKGKLKHYKYKQVDINVNMYATGIARKLKDAPVGSFIALKHANSPVWPELFWGILMAGFCPLLIDARASKEGTENLIKQAKAVALITDDMYIYQEKKIVPEDLEEYRGERAEQRWGDQVIFCSSGTTGDVKLMVFNGKNLCHQICCSLDMPKETKDLMYPRKMGKIHILAMVPFHHIFGFVAVFLWFSFYGCALVYPSSLAPSDIQNICQRGKVSHVFSVPLFWDSLAQQVTRRFAMMEEDKQKLLNNMIAYNLGEMSKEDAGIAASSIARSKVQKMLLGNNVRYAISGGGYLSSETLRTINGLGYNLYNGFGMTEIGVTSVEMSANVKDRLVGTIGHPLHGVEYKIKDGQLFVKSPTIHIREIIGGKEKETEFDEEGFFPTGDIAEMDERGCYSIKGRQKDVIINSDGENIFPDEIEIFFKDLPHINHLCVLGVAKKGKKNAEDIVLVLETDNQITEDEIKNIETLVKEIEPKLPHKVKIDAIYLSKGKLPLANNMKVKRFQIRKAIEGETGDYIPLNQKHTVKQFEGFDEKTIKEILEPVRETFSKVLLLPAFKIEDDAHWINDLGGDSMSYVELINELQNHFDISFPEETLGVMACVNDFVYEIAKIKKNNK